MDARRQLKTAANIATKSFLRRSANSSSSLDAVDFDCGWRQTFGIGFERNSARSSRWTNNSEAFPLKCSTARLLETRYVSWICTADRDQAPWSFDRKTYG